MLKIVRKHNLRPQSSFLENIEIEGNVAKVKMHQSSVIYTYAITNEQIRFLRDAVKKGNRVGYWFRENIRPQLITKTIPA